GERAAKTHRSPQESEGASNDQQTTPPGTGHGGRMTGRKTALPSTVPALVADDGTPFLLYAGDDEKVHIRALLHAETIWLTQRQLAELFQTTVDNVGLHLKNIFAEAELEELATSEEFSVVQNEGGRAVRRTLRHYNLDAIIATGYRVNSRRATQFRI